MTTIGLSRTRLLARLAAGGCGLLVLLARVVCQDAGADAQSPAPRPDQPRELTNAAITWSDWQHGVRIGLEVHTYLVQGRPLGGISFYVHGNASYRTNLIRPRGYSMFSIVLLDPAGRKVRRTSVARELGAPLPRRITQYGSHPGPLRAASVAAVSGLGSIRIPQLFDIRRDGVHRVKVEVRLLRRLDTGRSVEPVVYPLEAEVYLVTSRDTGQGARRWAIGACAGAAVLGGLLVWLRLRRSRAARAGAGTDAA